MDWTKVTKQELARRMDFSILPKETRESEIHDGCRIARQYGFAAFYTSSAYWAPLVRELLQEDADRIEIGTGIAFPFGSAPPAVKAFEVEDAVRRGCTAVDVVMNVAAGTRAAPEIVDAWPAPQSGAWKHAGRATVECNPQPTGKPPRSLTRSVRPEKLLKWDTAKLTFTNSAEAQSLVRRRYREGWEIEGV